MSETQFVIIFLSFQAGIHSLPKYLQHTQFPANRLIPDHVFPSYMACSAVQLQVCLRQPPPLLP